ncbi:MAG: hypothetical protein K6U80_00130 [Firmicutes bacterium]|nr:hypothetical protein [Bacillota bacterium]
MSAESVNIVARDNSGKLVKHIDEAKDWLEKARQEYIQANPIRGELILNLAQAELKYAWELSRGRFVSHNNGQVGSGEDRSRIRNFRSRLVLPIAAAFLTILGASLFWNLNLKPQPLAGNEKKAVVNETPAVLIQPTGSGPASSLQTNGKTMVVESSKPSGAPGESEPELTSKPIVQPSDSVTTPAALAEAPGASRIAENRQKLPYSNTQNNLQPVSQLNIDVDALTKEAAHSLRNGNNPAPGYMER